MRFSVFCFGQLRLFSLATGASLGLLLACGSSGDSGLFSSSAGARSMGGSPGSGGEDATGGSSKSAGGSSSTGSSGSGGAASGGQATGGSETGGDTGGDTAMSSGGASVSGGAGPTGGADSAGGQSAGANSGGSVSTGGQGGKATGGMSGKGTGGNATGGCSAKAVERCDGIDNDCNSMIDEQQACDAKCTGFALSGHGYMVCNVEVTAARAATLCEEQGLRLAWIETESENDELLQTIQDLGSSGRGTGILEVAIGATDADQEGHWHWRDGVDFWRGDDMGEPVDGAYTNWAEGRPNNSTAERAAGEDCGVLVIDQADDGDPGQWNDVECANSYGVLCEEP